MQTWKRFCVLPPWQSANWNTGTWCVVSVDSDLKNTLDMDVNVPSSRKSIIAWDSSHSVWANIDGYAFFKLCTKVAYFILRLHNSAPFGSETYVRKQALPSFTENKGSERSNKLAGAFMKAAKRRESRSTVHYYGERALKRDEKKLFQFRRVKVLVALIARNMDFLIIIIIVIESQRYLPYTRCVSCVVCTNDVLYSVWA